MLTTSRAKLHSLLYKLYVTINEMKEVLDEDEDLVKCLNRKPKPKVPAARVKLPKQKYNFAVSSFGKFDEDSDDIEIDKDLDKFLDWLDKKFN